MTSVASVVGGRRESALHRTRPAMTPDFDLNSALFPAGMYLMPKVGALMVAGSIIASSSLGVMAYLTPSEAEVPRIQIDVFDGMEAACPSNQSMDCA
jgi:hypothetical protein